METIDPNAVGQRSKDASRPWTWSIAMYAGPSPLRMATAPGASNPVISAVDVTDVPARFVADPFMVHVDGLWHMFFEVLNNQSNKGDIGRATSRDGLTWRYERIVLQEPFHLSYPYVFRWKDDFYMTPETLGANAVRLYRATSFPDQWTLVKDLIPGRMLILQSSSAPENGGSSRVQRLTSMTRWLFIQPTIPLPHGLSILPVPSSLAIKVLLGPAVACSIMTAG